MLLIYNYTRGGSMSNTRKAFMKAGAIVGIVMASLLMLEGLGLLMGVNMVTREFVIDIIIADGDNIANYSEEMIRLIVVTSKVIMVVMSLLVLGIATANLVLSIKVLQYANTENMKKGCVIALLVLSILAGNMITCAFMITTLSLKKRIIPMPAGTNDSENISSN